jgi:hypothetical protein
MKRLAAPLIAAFAIAASASAQPPVNTELGARICGIDPLPNESDADFDRRRVAERTVPDWIWAAFDAMQAVPDRMTFTLRRNGDERVLVASGLIDERAVANLRAALQRNAPISEIWFNSPGGDSRVGVEMGHLIRKEQLAVRVPPGSGCASACSTALLGGVIRKVEPGAVYGVHMYATVPTGQAGGSLSTTAFNDIQWMGAMGAAERVKYVQEMGISMKWLDIWSSTRPGCMTFLSQAELHTTYVNNVD